METYTFITHASQDKEVVEKLYAKLKAANLALWASFQDIKPGDPWDTAIQNALDGASHVVVVTSRQSVTSEYVRAEVEYALDNKKLVIPILIDDVKLPVRWHILQHVDWRNQVESAAFQNLINILPKATPPQPETTVIERLLYDSSTEKIPFETWTFYCSTGITGLEFSFIPKTDTSPHIAVFSARRNQSVGLNKSVSAIYGRAAFSYQVVDTLFGDSHVYFAMIPMQETGIGRMGLIEVGGDIEDDPANARSSKRIRYAVPAEHYQSGKWHSAEMEFDFRDTPTAFYSIFGPRINEGIDTPAPGKLMLKDVKIYFRV